MNFTVDTARTLACTVFCFVFFVLGYYFGTTDASPLCICEIHE